MNSTAADSVLLETAVADRSRKENWRPAPFRSKSVSCEAQLQQHPLKLVELTMLVNDPETALGEWRKLLSEKSNKADVIRFVQDLSSRQQWKLISSLIEPNLDSDSWELLTYGMHGQLLSQNY